MATEITVASQMELEATRGVSFYEEFDLLQNAGTEAAPVAGAPEDLTDWPTLVAMLDVAADQTLVRGVATMVSAAAGRFSLTVDYAELDRAFDTRNNSRPLHVTVKALNSAATRERVILNGVMRVRESGY